MHGRGIYDERYRRDADGRWRIARLDLRYLRQDWVPSPRPMG
jgi:hypothetical protein